MSAVVIDSDGITVDARLVAEGFGLTEGKVRELMRSGAITSRSETGEGEHIGRTRLNFLYGNRVLRLTIDHSGELLSPAQIDFTNSKISAARNCGAELDQDKSEH